MYTREESYKASLEYFEGDELAANVFINKYALRDISDKFLELTPYDMHHRLAKEISRIESVYTNPLSYDEIFNAIDHFRYIVPQGSPMAIIGSNVLGSLSNCLSGDTKISLLNGTEVPISDLVKDQEYWVYGCKPSGEVIPTKVKALGITRQDNKYAEVTLDNDEVVKCTTDHLFMLRDGTYKRADELIENESLMPLYRELSEDGCTMYRYEIYQDNSDNRYYYTHQTVGYTYCLNDQECAWINIKYILQDETEKSLVIHHCDFNKRNNEPSNLFWMGSKEHYRFHAEIGRKNLDKLRENPEYIAKMSEVSSKVMTELWKDSEFRERCKIRLEILHEKHIHDTVYLNRISKLMTELITELWKDPEFVARKKECSSKVMTKLNNENWAKSGYVEKMSKRMSDFNARPDVKEKVSKRIKEFNNRRDVHDRNVKRLSDKNEQIRMQIGKIFRVFNTLSELKIEINKDNFYQYKYQTNKFAPDPLGFFESCEQAIEEYNILNIKNHKVKSIRIVNSDELIDFYDMYSPETNNFALTAGVFVHNCFVVGASENCDNYNAILSFENDLVNLSKRRGGVGIDLSFIRQEGALVHNSARSSSGLVSFMKRYSNAILEVCQKGRRGALMLSCHVNHPDIVSFIEAKSTNNTVISGANISVRVTDEFIDSIKNDKDFNLKFPIDSNNIVYTVPAKYIWEKIITSTYKSAEPGVLFWDNIIRESPADSYYESGFRTIGTNPCGEVPLSAYDSCRLLAINLYSFVIDPFTDHAKFDEELFSYYVSVSVRIMDDIIDLEIEKIKAIINKVENDPEDIEYRIVELKLWNKILDRAVKGRRAGIGITAEADMLAALNIKYCSDEAISFVANLHRLIAVDVYKESINLAKERGSFLVFDKDLDINSDFIKRIHSTSSEMSELMNKGRRNIALLTIAPTGSVSIMTQTSSGIEPVYNIIYKRRVKINPSDSGLSATFVDEQGDEWADFVVVHPKFKTYLKTRGYTEKSINRLSYDILYNLVLESPYNGSQAYEIDPMKKVEMLGKIQKWVDHAISCTINLPEETSKEQVGDLYMHAYDCGMKGVSVYRDGSRDGVLISNSDNNGNGKKTVVYNDAPDRPKTLSCKIMRFMIDDDKWISFIGVLDNKPLEIFTGLVDGMLFDIPSHVTDGTITKFRDKDNTSHYMFGYFDHYLNHIGGDLSLCFNREYYNYAKLISGILRHGMPIVYVVNLIDNLNVGYSINSWKSGVIRSLTPFIVNGSKVSKSKCPECGSSLIYQEGCEKCTNCTYSKCS